METKTIIKGVISIAVLLGIVFLSQKPEFRLLESYTIKNGETQTNNYWVKMEQWFKTNILGKASGEASVIGASVTQEITKQKDNVVQGAWEEFKKYFAEKFSKTFGTDVK